MTNHLSKEIHILDCLFSILSFVICCLSDYSSKDFVTKYSYSSSTESSSSSIQALRVFLSMYSRQLCLKQKVESTESETGHLIRYLYKLMITCSTTPLFIFGHKKQSWNDTVGIWSCHSCKEYSYIHKNGTPHYQQCKGFQKMKENPTLMRCFSFRNWAPNPTRYTSSWSCAVQHLYSNLSTKKIMERQLTYDHVMVVKNIHIHIKWCTWLPTVQGYQKMKENPKFMRHFSPSVWGYKEVALESGRSQQVNWIDWHRDSQ
jgi:hypothetical protein